MLQRRLLCMVIRLANGSVVLTEHSGGAKRDKTR